MNEPRRHHLLPQFHLRRFANDRDQVRVVGLHKRRSFCTSVEKAAAEVDFYTITTSEGHASQEVERSLHKIEDRGAPAIANILNGQFPPSPEDRLSVAAFIALQSTRGRDQRHAWNAMTDYMVKFMLQGATEESLRERLTDAYQRPARDEEVQAVLDLAGNPARWKAESHQNEPIEAFLNIAPQLVPVLLECRWRLGRFREPLLLTADTPIALWSANPVSFRGVGLKTADQIRFALDRRHVLILSHTAGHEAIWDLHPLHAADFNRSTASNAYEWIYHHPDHDPLDGIELPPPRAAIEIEGPLPASTTDGKEIEIIHMKSRALG